MDHLLAARHRERKGELLGLRWEDIDWESNQIKITRAIAYADGGEIVKQPKTKSSRRTVTVPGVVMNLLRAWKKEQTETRLYLGDYWQESGWVFTQENGLRMNYSTPRHAFHQVLEQYNKDHPKEPLPLIPFHGLRHTSATLLIADRQDIRSVAARLGHSQTSTTLNIYAHALKESDQKAADSLATMLKKHA